MKRISSMNIGIDFVKTFTNDLLCYRPQRSCGQGYVFTRVCDSVHGGGSPGRPLPPAGRTPPGSGRHPPARRTPPGSGRPPLQWEHPPRDQADTPPPPGRRLQHTVNERPVRILLECILVRNVFQICGWTLGPLILQQYVGFSLLSLSATPDSLLVQWAIGIQ